MVALAARTAVESWSMPADSVARFRRKVAASAGPPAMVPTRLVIGETVVTIRRRGAVEATAGPDVRMAATAHHSTTASATVRARAARMEPRYGVQVAAATSLQERTRGFLRTL